MLTPYTFRALASGLNSKPAALEIDQLLTLLGGAVGEVFYVNSVSGSDGAGAGKILTKPFATLQHAVNQCVANRGDLIIVLPGHAETIVSAGAIDVDKASTTVVGLGSGANRPTFTLTTAVTASFDVTEDNVTVKNCLFVAGIDALTGPVDISGDDVRLLDCEYRDDDSENFETTDVVIVSGERVEIAGFKFNHAGGSGGTQIQSVINATSAAANLHVHDCFIVCDGALGCIETLNAKQVDIHDNILESTHANDVCITLGSTATGHVYRNFCRIATDAQTTWISSGDAALYENYGVNNDGETGILVGTPSE